MVAFRAALNQALDEGDVLTNRAWRAALKPHKSAGTRRNIYLDRVQRRALIDALPFDVATFVRGLSLLPLRPGAVAGLLVDDFDARRHELVIARDKSGQGRHILLPSETALFLKELSRRKNADEHLFVRSDGSAWNKDAWKWPIKDAVRRLELPGKTSAYTLRHSTITDLVTGGLDLLTVAKVSGTSVAMIEKHYGHLRNDIAAKALEKLAL